MLRHLFEGESSRFEDRNRVIHGRFCEDVLSGDAIAGFKGTLP